MTRSKSMKIHDGIVRQKTENKAFVPIPTNYLSDTDAEEYLDYPKLLDMTRADRESRILKLWRSCFNCSIGVAIMLK